MSGPEFLAKYLSSFNIPDSALDLLQGLLRRKPLERITIEQVLTHRFFSNVINGTKMSTSESDSISVSIMDSICSNKVETVTKDSNQLIKTDSIVELSSSTPNTS